MSVFPARLPQILRIVSDSGANLVDFFYQFFIRLLRSFVVTIGRRYSSGFNLHSYNSWLESGPGGNQLCY